MQHTLRFRACDDGSVLLEEHTLAYGLVSGYERCAAELGVSAGRQVRMELLDDAGRLLDWRTYLVSVTGGQFPAVLPHSLCCPADAFDQRSSADRRVQRPRTVASGAVTLRRRWQPVGTGGGRRDWRGACLLGF